MIRPVTSNKEWYAVWAFVEFSRSNIVGTLKEYFFCSLPCVCANGVTSSSGHSCLHTHVCVIVLCIGWFRSVFCSNHRHYLLRDNDADWVCSCFICLSMILLSILFSLESLLSPYWESEFPFLSHTHSFLIWSDSTRAVYGLICKPLNKSGVEKLSMSSLCPNFQFL
jgi:hypothetical protein